MTSGLSTREKNWLYRPGGWSIKQVVHHCADSHMNCLIRFKWTLTESTPTIKAYFEARWANLIDSQDDNLDISIQLLTSLHHKLVQIIGHLTEEQLNLTFIHPEHGTAFSLKETVGNYAWHCQHHLSHIKQALQAKGLYN